MKYIDSPSAADMPGELVWIFNFWNDLKGERDIPSRRDFKPEDLAGILPGVTLTDVEWNPLRFRVRLAGTGIVQSIGRDMTGRYYDEFLDGETLARITRCVQNREPLLAIDKPLIWASKDYASYSLLNLPLANEGEPVNMLLVQMIFKPLKSLVARD